MPRRLELRKVLGPLLALLLLTSGCQVSQPKAPDAPPVVLSVTHFAGSPFSGPDEVSDLGEAEAFRNVSVTLLNLPEFPGDLYEPAATRARFIFAVGEALELMPTLVLARGARFGDGEQATAPIPGATELGSATGVVGPGMTAEFSVTGRDDPPGQDDAGYLVLFVSQSRRSGDTTLTFALAAPTGGEELAIRREESAAFGLETGSSGTAVIVLPWVFTVGDGAIVAVVQTSPGPQPGSGEYEDFRTHVLSSVTEAAEAFARSRASATPISSHALVEQAMLKAVEASEEIDGGRRTLMYLAQATQASFAEDVAMLAPEAVFLTYRQGVIAELGKQKGAAEPLDIGWILEGWACRATLHGFARGQVGDEFAAAIVRCAGEVGRHPGLFADIADESTSLEDFQRRLLRENFTFLLDAEPGSRVWAYDWLTEAGHAPAGYDPLGDKEDRRAALRKAAEEGENKP